MREVIEQALTLSLADFLKVGPTGGSKTLAYYAPLITSSLASSRLPSSRPLR